MVKRAIDFGKVDETRINTRFFVEVTIAQWYNSFTMKAYRFKLKPSQQIGHKLEGTLDICRELYNGGLQERRDAYKLAGKSINFHNQAIQLPEIKQTREDVANINAQVLQDVLRRLSKAFDNFFRRIEQGAEKPGYPRFKGKFRYNSFTYPQGGKRAGFKLIGKKLYLSKIGSMKVFLTQPILGTIKTCTIKREADGWYVIFAVEEIQSRFLPKTGQTTGIDVGIENFATLTNGEVIENPKHYRKAEKRLKTAQRKVSRRKLKSKRRRQAAQLLAKQHLKVKRQRQDFHHKESLKLVKEYDQITFENLNIAGMMRNHHLAKSIADAGWNSFISITTAKAGSAGRLVVKVPAAFSSQDCSQCGNRVRKTLSQREHRCIACGFIAHRDHNSAILLDKKGTGSPFGLGVLAAPVTPRTYPV